MSLGELFDAQRLENPMAKAVADLTFHLTYRELGDRVDHVAAGLGRLGVGTNDRAALILPDQIEAVILFWALQKVGAIVIPINPQWAPGQITYCLQDAQPTVLITQGGVIGRDPAGGRPYTAHITLRDSPGTVSYGDLQHSRIDNARYTALRQESDVAVILYTSGTSGHPKGVPRSHQTVVSAARDHVVNHGYQGGERVLGAMPLAHTMGLHLMVASVLCHGCYVACRDADPEAVFELIAKEQITALYALPSLYYTLMGSWRHDPEDVASVTKLGYAGIPMSDEVLHSCLEYFHPQKFINHYGSTEVFTHSIYDVRGGKPACVGRASPRHPVKIAANGETFQEAAVEEIGEIMVAPNASAAFAGYWHQPALTADAVRGGWYHSGDLGYRDGDGDIFLVGRKDDLIISAGEHIVPQSIEAILLSHPHVAEVVVTGEPDARWGQRVVAYVVPTITTLSAYDLDCFCKDQPGLSSTVRPRQYVFVRHIPKSTTGKVLRRVLGNMEGHV